MGWDSRVESRGMRSVDSARRRERSYAMCEARLMSGQAIREDLTHTLRGWTWEIADQAAATGYLAAGGWAAWTLVHI